MGVVPPDPDLALATLRANPYSRTSSHWDLARRRELDSERAIQSSVFSEPRYHAMMNSWLTLRCEAGIAIERLELSGADLGDPHAHVDLELPIDELV